MKTNALSLLALTGALFLMASCANEETNSKQEPEQKPDAKGLTAFVVDSRTRTTADYDGSGLNFYWTEGDRLWLKNNGTLVQDTKNDIDKLLAPNPTMPTAVKRTATARFYYKGDYYAPTYHVRYTGKGNPVSDKVTIKDQQAQALPNDAAHISEDGDCGTAMATKSGIEYSFTLDHKASYLTLLPYSTINFATSVKLTQIKITADEALSGQFNFDDSGIDLGSRPAPTPANRSITLKLNGGGTNGFVLPVAATKETNSSVMVVPPGTYHNVTIEYSLYDQISTKSAIIKREYATLTFTPGKNKKITTNLKMRVYITPMGGFWEGHGPNTNEAMWYIHNGDPHLDQTAIYAAQRSTTLPANICSGGIWLKKKANIPGFSGTEAPNGVNYISFDSYLGKWSSRVNNYALPLSRGIPTNINDYYFLPSVSPYGSTGVTSTSGSLRYWIGTRCAIGWTLGQVLAVDVPPLVTSPNIGIGCNYLNVVLLYWDKQ